MKQNYSQHLIATLRNEAKIDLTKQSVIAQFTQLIDDADLTTLEFISCQLTLLQSFKGSGGKDADKS